MRVLGVATVTPVHSDIIKLAAEIPIMLFNLIDIWINVEIHLKKEIVDGKFCISINNPMNLAHQGSIDNKSILVYLVAGHGTCDKPLTNLIMIEIIEAI